MATAAALAGAAMTAATAAPSTTSVAPDPAPPAPVRRYALEQLASAPYYRVTLNDAVYAASLRGDLGDLRILNSAGEFVPYSFDNTAAPTRPATRRPLRWFPLPAAASPGAADSALSVTIGPDGGLRAAAKPPPAATRGGDVIDLGADSPPLSALLIHLQDSSWQGRVDISASEDLRAWTPVIQAPLLKAASGDATLAQERVDLDGLRARYVRLRWPDGAPALAGIEGESIPVDATPPTRAWRGGIATRAGASPGEYLFDTGGAYPVDRIQFDLPQANTVAYGQLYSRNDARQPWRMVAAGQLLRLQGGSATNAAGDEQRNPPWAVPVDTDRQWRLLVDTRGGGLGSGQPTVALGWRPTVVTFVARGAGPFVLAVGNSAWEPVAVPLADLMAVEAAAPAQARLGQELAPMPAALAARPADPDSNRRYVLWAVLVVAVVVLGLMAWRLSRANSG
ncbi:DUF3999 domain-containing protein [Achromobacter aloeverae]|uniref:DUF3999 domain-containing protein n=1 Tax=Achromobacter aloeverae TaxID=1750518 RepID=A0A4Q1HGV8_9BURK|nr:DUF3999 domain-containing protein [Achromobacter aloeverae]